MGNKPVTKRSAPTRVKNLEESIYEAMRRNGQVVPQAVEDVLRAEAEGAGTGECGDLPAELQDPYTVLRRSSEKKILEFQPNERGVDAETQKEVARAARAARAGKEIPAEVEERMRRDREAADRENQD